MPRRAGRQKRWTTVAVLAVLPAAFVAAGDGDTDARKWAHVEIKTPRYLIRTDIEDKWVLREAEARMTSLAREYDHRIRDFGRRVKRRLPLYMFTDADDYHAAGGMEGSSGMYNGRALLALADPIRLRTRRIWHILQHEAWHQYVHTVVGTRMPIWANEGMAEYFGEGIWTGDGYVTGIIPRWRLKLLKLMIDREAVMPFALMLQVTPAQWREDLNMRHYTQAWAMIHFLAHADGEKYRPALDRYLTEIIIRRRPWHVAFKRAFDGTPADFEERFAEWWKDRDAGATDHLRTKATVATLTSFLARAVVQGQSYETAEAFFEAARAGKLGQLKGQWLPPSLLARALGNAAKLEEWSIEAGRGLPKLVLELADGTRFVGTFKRSHTAVKDVSVRIVEPR